MEENDREKDDLSGERVENNSPDGDTKSNIAKNIPSFSDLWKGTERNFENTKLLSEYLGQQLLIESCEFGQGAYGDYVLLTVSVNGGKRTLRSSSAVVVDQVKKLGDKLPFKATPLERNGKNGMKFQSLS